MIKNQVANDNSIPPSHLQRLIDGELDVSQIQVVLQKAQANPENWRLIATSFIENQIWQAGFLAEANVVETSVAQPVSTNVAAPYQSTSRWLAMAALFVLGASLSYLLLQNQRATDNDPGGLARSNQSSEQTSQSGPLSSVAANDQQQPQEIVPAFYQVKMEDAQGQPIVDSQVPLYSGGRHSMEHWLKQIEQSDRALRRRHSGYQLNGGTRYFSGRTEDGRSFVIPVRNYRYAPGQ